MSAPDSRFVRACRGLPVDTTPVWFMRQAGRYMPEYRAVRERHSLLEICKRPELAAEVTITAAERLGVDAAIIFADLLLPLEVMGAPFHFAAGEGPVIERPLRTAGDVSKLRTDRAADLGYVADSVRAVARHFGARLPVIGFCGAPFTVASYMIEGKGSRNYIETKKLMHGSSQVWTELMSKLVTVLSEYAADQVRAGADAIQIFDSWVGCLSPEDFRKFVFPHSQQLVAELRATGVPVIYFGTDTAGLLELVQQTGADVIGVDWRIDLDTAWERLKYRNPVQGNLDPALLFEEWPVVRAGAQEVLRRAGGRAGHIFNLGHGIFPTTPVENVRSLVDFVHENSTPGQGDGATPVRAAKGRRLARSTAKEGIPQ